MLGGKRSTSFNLFALAIMTSGLMNLTSSPQCEDLKNERNERRSVEQRGGTWFEGKHLMFKEEWFFERLLSIFINRIPPFLPNRDVKDMR